MFGLRPRVEELERWRDSTREKDNTKAISDLNTDLDEKFENIEMKLD